MQSLAFGESTISELDFDVFVSRRSRFVDVHPLLAADILNVALGLELAAFRLLSAVGDVNDEVVDDRLNVGDRSCRPSR